MVAVFTATQDQSVKTSSETSEISSNLSHCLNLLQKMSANWHRRAQVGRVRQKVEEQSGSDLAFDPQRDDFRVDLLPFKDHPLFLAAPIEFQKRALSCGWLAYNEKTVDIESKVIAPACSHIIYREVPGADDGTSQLIASDTLVDEAYHIQLVVAACRITREQRGLEFLRLPAFNLATQMEREKSLYPESWKKILVQMATSIVSEVFISDYLDLLARDQTIQPLNRLTVYTHRMDEKAHHSIFKTLATCIYAHLNPEEQKFFAEILPKPVRWFANVELDVWDAMLKQIQFPNAEKIIQDCRAIAEVDVMRIDYSDIVSLAEELGILDTPIGFDSFAKAGLLEA